MKSIKELRAELETTIKENKKLKRQIKHKDKEIQTLLKRIELWKNKNKNKTIYKPKKKYFQWDKECRYYKKCKNRAIKECDICKKTGIYKGESL